MERFYPDLSRHFLPLSYNRLISDAAVVDDLARFFGSTMAPTWRKFWSERFGGAINATTTPADLISKYNYLRGVVNLENLR